MRLIEADYIFTGSEYIKDGAVVFDKRIIDIGDSTELKRVYSNAKVTTLEPHSIIYPGFINPHVHLEFSSNRSDLSYGDFGQWLDSVIQNRDRLFEENKKESMDEAINQMLQSGVTTYGAISSNGFDIEAALSSPQRVVFFNEFIGSNPAYIDMLYNDFLERLKSSQEHQSDTFMPAVAIHSPYSTHPIALKKIVAKVKEQSLLLTAHFLESASEKEWLKNGEGYFKSFFQKHFNTSKPTQTAMEFLELLDNTPTLLTHATEVGDDEIAMIKKANHSIIHCPRSNRLLGCKRAPIERFKQEDITVMVGTDGLSSNYNLNLFDELRAALMLHHLGPLSKLSLMLIKAVTSNAGRVLGLDIGELKVGYHSDMIAVTLPSLPKSKEELALMIILHTNKADKIIIAGEDISCN